MSYANGEEAGACFFESMVRLAKSRMLM